MATATFTGELFGLQDSPAIGTYPKGKLAGGNVYCSTDVCYASGTDLDAGSTMKVGKLPKGAVVLYSIVYPIDTATYGAPDAMTNAVTGSLGISGDTDLFGDVTDMNASATPQVVVPKPDGTTYVIDDNSGASFDVALEADVDVLFTTADAALTATEGVCVKIFYTM
jgi:hypothetical protein